MRLTIKQLKTIIKECLIEGTFDPGMGTWDSDEPGKRNIIKQAQGGGGVDDSHFRDIDPRYASVRSDAHLKMPSYKDQDVEDDYNQTTQQGAYELDPTEYGVQAGLEDPMYDRDSEVEEVPDEDEMHPDFREMGWQKLAHEKHGRGW